MSSGLQTSPPQSGLATSPHLARMASNSSGGSAPAFSISAFSRHRHRLGHVGPEYLKRSYDQKGMYGEAIAARQTRRKLLGREAGETAALRAAASTTSSKIYWQKRLEQEIEESKREGIPEFEMAEILAQMGETDRALDWLEKALGEHDFMIIYAKVAPNLDPLRSEPRFAELMRRVGLPQ